MSDYNLLDGQVECLKCGNIFLLSDNKMSFDCPKCNKKEE